MRLSSLLRSTGFRTGLRYAALFSASVLVLFAIVYWETAGYMARQLHVLVNGDIQSLVDRYHRDGIADLRQAIDHRVQTTRGHEEGYLLLDKKGAVIAGNLAPMVPKTGWFEIQVPRGSQRVATGDTDEDQVLPVMGRGVTLNRGVFLFVGRDASSLDEMQERVLDALFWGLGTMLLLALMGATVMGRTALRRVEEINRVTGQIVQGSLTRRIPIRGTHDEFDTLAEHLNLMLERIQTLMESMRQVSADIAHDLRTPLGRLRHRLEATRREAHTVEEYRTALDQAIAEADQISETFSALLSIAQIESGSRKSRFADVDLSAALETVTEAYAPVAEEQGQRLCTQITPGIHLCGDRDLLVQLFANLVENALHHTPPGSRIDVMLQSSPEGADAVVSDNGPGIPEQSRSKVTRRFYRLEASRSTPGSGLGLSLVAAIADLHGADLRLGENAPGLRVMLHFRRQDRAGHGRA